MRPNTLYIHTWPDPEPDGSPTLLFPTTNMLLPPGALHAGALRVGLAGSGGASEGNCILSLEVGGGIYSWQVDVPGIGDEGFYVCGDLAAAPGNDAVIWRRVHPGGLAVSEVADAGGLSTTVVADCRLTVRWAGCTLRLAEVLWLAAS